MKTFLFLTMVVFIIFVCCFPAHSQNLDPSNFDPRCSDKVQLTPPADTDEVMNFFLPDYEHPPSERLLVRGCTPVWKKTASDGWTPIQDGDFKWVVLFVASDPGPAFVRDNNGDPSPGPNHILDTSINVTDPGEYFEFDITDHVVRGNWIMIASYMRGAQDQEGFSVFRRERFLDFLGIRPPVLVQQ